MRVGIFIVFDKNDFAACYSPLFDVLVYQGGIHNEIVGMCLLAILITVFYRDNSLSYPKNN